MKHIFNLGDGQDQEGSGCIRSHYMEFFVQKENNDKKIFLIILGNLQCRDLENRLASLLSSSLLENGYTLFLCNYVHIAMD